MKMTDVAYWAVIINRMYHMVKGITSIMCNMRNTIDMIDSRKTNKSTVICALFGLVSTRNDSHFAHPYSGKA